VCVYVCVFFSLATFVHFSRASSSQISFLCFVLFCFVVSFGKILSSEFWSQELLPPCRMEQKGLIPSLMCYWPSSCLLLECFSNMGSRYVHTYACLVVVVVFLLLLHHHQLWNFNLSLNLLFCFISFFLSIFGAWWT
jgi:hypothetical protein